MSYISPECYDCSDLRIHLEATQRDRTVERAKPARKPLGHLEANMLPKPYIDQALTRIVKGFAVCVVAAIVIGVPNSIATAPTATSSSSAP